MSSSILKKIVSYKAILTPTRRVGEEKISDRSGPKVCAIGTSTGENKGTAELASCKGEVIFSQSSSTTENSYIGLYIIYFLDGIPCY